MRASIEARSSFRMKKTHLTLLCAAALLGACTPTVANRGNILDLETLAQIKPGITTREEVATKLGTPTSVSTFDEKIWYYVGRETVQYSFLTPDVVKQQAVEIDFNDQGIVTAAKNLDLSQAGEVATVSVRRRPMGSKTPLSVSCSAISATRCRVWGIRIPKSYRTVRLLIVKLLFVNLSALKFTVQTPDHAPLGGSESSLCYLARALAQRGHEVSVIANLPEGQSGVIENINHYPVATLKDPAFFATEKFGAIIVCNAPAACVPLKALSPTSRIVFWAHALPDQPAMQALAQATDERRD